MKLSIFILAAGLGERLQPITGYIPKPLIPILGKPILQIILEKISTLPVNKIGINLHHKKEFIENWINQSAFGKMVKLFPEYPILGTGGALKNAEGFLSSSTFLVHNSDILSDIDLEKLLESHLFSNNLVTLAVHDYPEFNNLIIDEEGFLKGVGKTRNLKVPFQHPHPNPPPFSPSPCGRGQVEGGDEHLHLQPEIERCMAFTGIAVYSSEFFKFLPLGISSVIDAWLNALAAGHKIGTADVSGCYWNDIGTPASYASAIIDALRADGETVYIHPSAKGCRNVEMDGYLIIEKGNILDKGISLRNCIVLPSSLPRVTNNPPSPPFSNTSPFPPFTKGGIGGLQFKNCILGPDFKIDLNESEILGYSEEAHGILIGSGGSNRKYYRIKKNNSTIIVMKCMDGEADYHRHIEYTKFFSKYNIPVPELIEEERDKMNASFEDLGDVSLYSWLKCRREDEEIEKMYKKALDIAVQLHTKTTKNVSECPMLESRIFDYEHFRWETGYFIERFVGGIKNTKIKNLSAIQDEFHRLASKADSYPKTVIHRDFQSQNIMIHLGIPRLIDYQGARMGLPAYDVASILWDPYYRLKDDMRERLLEYYVDEMVKHHSPITPDTFLLCRLQRHMQALGAYGFLSEIKGKKYFLKHVPEGLRLLKEDVSSLKDDYPELYGLVMKL